MVVSAGIIDEIVDAAPDFVHAIENAAHGARIRYIPGYGERVFGSERPGRSLCRRRVAVQYGDPSSERHHRPCRCRADARAGAGDQDAPILQSIVHTRCPPSLFSKAVTGG